MTPRSQYLKDLKAAADELEAAEDALHYAAIEAGQGDDEVPLVVHRGTPLDAAVQRVVAARHRADEIMASAPPLPPEA